MSTIQIKKEWRPESNKDPLPEKMFTAEDLIGLSWILFEDNEFTNRM